MVKFLYKYRDHSVQVKSTAQTERSAAICNKRGGEKLKGALQKILYRFS